MNHPALAPELRPLLSDLRTGLVELYGDRLARVVLFGSQARGDARPWSDVDVAIVLKGPVRTGGEIDRTSRLVSSLSLEHDLVIARVFLGEDEFTTGRNSLARSLRREGIEI